MGLCLIKVIEKQEVLFHLLQNHTLGLLYEAFSFCTLKSLKLSQVRETSKPEPTPRQQQAPL